MQTTTDTKPSGTVDPSQVDVPTVASGPVIPAKTVNGTGVYNKDGEHLGHVYDIMIDKRTGVVAFALMSFGGFLGIGERFHPLPWSVLDYDEKSRGYVVDLDREALEEGPNYGFGDSPDWQDVRLRMRIYDHYGAPYYWL